MDAGDTYLLIILLILLLFSSFFSSTETALMSVNKIKLRSLADGGNKRAALALDITENHTAKMLSAILIGNNIVNVSASSLATTLAYSFGGYMVSIATLILTVYLERLHRRIMQRSTLRSLRFAIFRSSSFS